MLVHFGHDTICIDGTHGLNNYNFQLYTIVDEYGNEYPVAFCFSNKSDTATYKHIKMLLLISIHKFLCPMMNKHFIMLGGDGASSKTVIMHMSCFKKLV